MRTLKKSLALVLALVMLLGLGVVGASADNALDNYTDADEIGDAYLEAVGVLTGLGIVDGMTETTIVPQATYTRAQAAKIITTMVLGVNGAKSCVASYAPFQDVAAEHWAAGYIAFCKEQGIIDGVTDTTFDPEGTLTGYQWAKMLLAAVGFNANNELEGSSWSLNTARIGHEVGLFDGDPAGADHTPLRREQAMLYAFNTLSKVGQVVWSDALGDYIYGYGDWVVDRYTPETTLGWSTFKLNSVEGIIVKNEGMGNKTTDIYDDYNTADGELLATISADTDAYMLYHGVRVWYVDGNKVPTDKGTGTAIYVNDLAKVTTLTCPTKTERDKLYKDVKDLYKGLTVGEDKTYDPYEVALIDNSAVSIPSAIEDNAQVYYYMTVTKLGDRDKSTVEVGNADVKYDNIWTNIDDINNGSDIIVMRAGTVYYIYAVGSTSGAVSAVRSNGDIVLTDGTVLEQSVFFTGNTDDIEETVYGHTGPNYTFVLDTHGHYISYTDKAYRAVGYYTGDLKSDFNNIWSSDVEFVALFFNVDTGKKVEVPVTRAWANEYKHDAGYYDITDELYNDSRFAPIALYDTTLGDDSSKVEADDTYNYYGYVYFESVTLSTSGWTATSKGNTVVYDADDDTIRVLVGDGEDAVCNSYSGVDAVLDDYTETFNADSITLYDVVMNTTTSPAGNKAATVIFTPEGIYDFVLSGIVFFPEGLDSSDITETGTGYIAYDSAYVNGRELDDFKVKAAVAANLDLEPGFYNFQIDASTLFVEALIPVPDQAHVTDKSQFTADADGSDIRLNKVRVANDAVIADIRGDKEELMSYTELASFMKNNFTNEAAELVYTLNSDGEIGVIYVVDANTYTATVNFAKGAEWENCTLVLPEKMTFGNWSGTHEIEVTVKNTGDWDTSGYTFQVTGSAKDGTITISSTNVDNDADTLTFTVTVSASAHDVVISALTAPGA